MALPTQAERIRNLELDLRTLSAKDALDAASNDAEHERILKRIEAQDKRLRDLEIRHAVLERECESLRATLDATRPVIDRIATLDERIRKQEVMIDTLLSRWWQFWLAILAAAGGVIVAFVQK